jgi:hypothetical protein
MVVDKDETCLFDGKVICKEDGSPKVQIGISIRCPSELEDKDK